ncbi:hypothetical protein [Hymenobacter latericus]|uniref:hypothetical protein n=1 Tax=Hymenobacter sp. YIM 151858-1 TaxID=2987688 RepID=UPI0022280481|nr:hypothetical protein [Hymenobacter sp. YIM 151858-1]UYZ58063.1 hypothetical protein OIS50_13460 [Hymenobacter sp. YIM 151858-1]
MQAYLCIPNEQPRPVATDGLCLPHPESGYAQLTDREAELLGCSRQMVDILASGRTHVAYSIFDYEGGEANLAAMQLLAGKWGWEFDMNEEPEVLKGPVLIVFEETADAVPA